MLGPLAGLAPFQLGFVAWDLELAVREFDALLGQGPWQGHVFDGEFVAGRTYHGVPATWSFRVVVNACRPQLEIIEPLAKPNIYGDWLNTRGEGFHHVGYVVASVEATSAAIEKLGHPRIQGGHSFGADGDGVFAYYDTADSLGFIVEACELADRLPEPAFRL